MRQRNISIDILKSFAVLAITNSHMDMLYVKYSGLATGGAIGDALFFFASGFTILLGGGKLSTISTNGESKEFIPQCLLGH